MHLLREPEIRAAMGWRSPTSTRNAIKDGLLPPPVKVSTRCWGLPSSEVDLIIKAKIAGQSEQQIKALVALIETQRAAELEEAMQ